MLRYQKHHRVETSFLYILLWLIFLLLFFHVFSLQVQVCCFFSSCKQQAFYKRLSNIVAPRKRVYCMRRDMWFKPRTWLVFLSNTNPVQVQGAVGICPVRTCGNDVNLQTRLRLIIHRLVYMCLVQCVFNFCIFLFYPLHHFVDMLARCQEQYRRFFTPSQWGCSVSAHARQTCLYISGRFFFLRPHFDMTISHSKI